MTEADTVTDTATNRRLFIGGLFPEITEDELRQRFKTFGNVSSVEIKIRKDYDGTPLKTFAYVDIETNDADFKKLMNSYNKTKWRGSELKIQKAKENFLLRLEQERQQQKEELENPRKEKSKKLNPSSDVQNKLLDIAGVGSVANMKPDGAKPGSTISGHKDWIVGKYGRVLPIVQMKKNYMTKPMKIDPSKYTHTVKKLKETDDRTKSCVNLTWQLEERENEITKKRKGEFPAWKPEKKRCADFDEIQQKLQEIISRHMVEGDMAEMEVVPVSGIGEATKISTTNTNNVLVTKQAGSEQFYSDSDSDEDRTQAGYRGDANLDLSRFDSDDDDDDNDGGSKPNVALSEKTKPLSNKSVALPKNSNKDRTESISRLKTIGSVVSKVADSKTDTKQSKAETKAVKATPKLIEGKKTLTEFRGLKFMSIDVPVETDVKPGKEIEKAPVIVFDIDDDKNVPGKSQNKRVYNSSDEDDDIDLNRASVSNKIVASKKPKTNFSVSKTFASQYSFTNEFASGIIEGVDDVKSVTNRFSDNDNDDDDDDDSDFESLVQKEMSKMNSSSNRTQSETRVGPPSLSISRNENKTVSKVKETKRITKPESVKHSETVFREGKKTVSKSNINVVGSQKGGNVKASATISVIGNKVVLDNGENDSSSEDDVSDDNISDKDVGNINVKGDDDGGDEDTEEEDDDDDSGESYESDSDDDESNPESQNNDNVKTDVSIPGEIVDDSSDEDDDDDDDSDDDSDSESEETSKAKNSAISVDDTDDDDNDDSSDSESEDEKEVVVKKQDNTAVKNTGVIPTKKQKDDENSDASESNEDDDYNDDDDDDDSDDDSNDGNESDASSNFEQTIREALIGTKTISQPFIKITTPKDENKGSKNNDKENAIKAIELKSKVVTGDESSSENSDDSSDNETENDPDIVTDKQKNVKVAENVLDDTDSSESEDTDSESGEDNIVMDLGIKEATKSCTNMNKDSKDDSESSETDSDSDDDDSDDDDNEIQIKSKTVSKDANNDELVTNDDRDSSESDSETDDDDDDDDKQVKSETVKNPVVTQKSNLRMTQTLNKIERKQAVQSNNRNTSQKPDNMSRNFRQTGKIFEPTENKDDTDRKRLEAVKLRQQENKAQQSLIQTALANIDKGAPTNNKIVFDSDSENDTVAMGTDVVAMDTQENKQNTDSADILAKLGFESESKGKSLFDSSDDSDNDDDGDRFKIRKEFEGTGGKKLATLQSRYGNDERFKLDSRFIESDSEEEVPEIEIEDETQRSLKILQSVVGVKAMRGVSKMDKAKKQFKDIGTLKYDPTKQEHQQQFEIKTAPKEQPVQEPKSKKKKRKKDLPVEEVPEVELPEVSKDKFYEVSDSLKNTFIEKAQTDTQSEAQTGTGFSLLSTFGKNQSGDKSQNEAQSSGGFSLLSMFGRHTSDDEKSDNEGVAIPIPQTLRTNQMSLDNRFKVVDDSDDDDDDSGVDNQRSTDDEKSTVSKNKQDITEKAAALTTTVSKPSTFFFLPDDVRLKDTAKTSEPADTDRKSWFEKRRHLIDSYKSKYNNYKRKHKDDKKHIGGPRRGRGGRRR